jgi:hypothetical protein
MRSGSIALACSITPAFAQLAAEDFSVANTHLWGIELHTVGVHHATGGNPGGCIQLDVSLLSSVLQVPTFMPAALEHPWSGDCRAQGITGFSFDREVLQGSANFQTRPHLLSGNHNGTRADYTDDARVWADPGDVFQFGPAPWKTIQSLIPSAQSTLPAGWGAVALSGNPHAGTLDLNLLWNLILQDVDYIGVAFGQPYNGVSWFGDHTLRFDNLILEGVGFDVPYCTAVANSTGATAVLRGLGSPFVNANDLTLSASALPPGTFGYFLTSRTQGFVPNAGGSHGNLCLAGAVGRYVGPGQIQNSGASGALVLALDLHSMPQPSGFIGALAGETWSFQAWYRDAVGGVATSNFSRGAAVQLR